MSRPTKLSPQLARAKRAMLKKHLGDTRTPVATAWALVHDETGRAVLCDWSPGGVVAGRAGSRLEQFSIFAQKQAAHYFKNPGERVIRVALIEIDP